MIVSSVQAGLDLSSVRTGEQLGQTTALIGRQRRAQIGCDLLQIRFAGATIGATVCVDGRKLLCNRDF